MSHDAAVTSSSTATTDPEGLMLESPLALTLEEFVERMDGRGRALGCWQCYRYGVDPIWYYQGKKNEQDDNQVEPLPFALMADDSHVDNSGDGGGGWTRGQFRQAFQQTSPASPSNLSPTKSLLRLSRMASIEHTVARLTYQTTSRDGTTKLLLRLHDGLEVETVIIPWEDERRSTLCIS